MMSWRAGASKDDYGSPSKAKLMGRYRLHKHVTTGDPTSLLILTESENSLSFIISLPSMGVAGQDRFTDWRCHIQILLARIMAFN